MKEKIHREFITKIDVSNLNNKINFEELVNEVLTVDDTAVLSRAKSDDGTDAIIIQEADETKLAAIKLKIKAHNPEFSDEEKIIINEQQAFDAKVLAALKRLGVVKDR